MKVLVTDAECRSLNIVDWARTGRPTYFVVEAR
jgi:hypothetical protein